MGKKDSSQYILIICFIENPRGLGVVGPTLFPSAMQNGKPPILLFSSTIKHPSSSTRLLRSQAQSFNSSSLPTSISLRIFLR